MAWSWRWRWFVKDFKVVLLDNYDSYVYNLYQAVGELTGVEAKVFRNSAITISALKAEAPSHLIISPGPGNPEDPAYFGVSRAAILELGPRIPILGVCLGHQGIGAAYGGQVMCAREVMHGKTSLVTHDGSSLFHQVPNPFEAMRYHSLVLKPETLPAELAVTAWTPDGVVMAIRHRRFPTFGVQFHPESIGTPAGKQLLSNFLSVD
jgi:anthranilate synthase/aminodeoxychorismate synthase-like glutamine amidotransferase